MSALRVGMKVKKSRGDNAGVTGVVVVAPNEMGVMTVRADVAWTRYPGDWDEERRPAGSTGTTWASEWEPLTPPKQQETITWDEACFDRDGRYRETVPLYAGGRA